MMRVEDFVMAPPQSAKSIWIKILKNTENANIWSNSVISLNLWLMICFQRFFRISRKKLISKYFYCKFVVNVSRFSPRSPKMAKNRPFQCYTHNKWLPNIIFVWFPTINLLLMILSSVLCLIFDGMAFELLLC